MLRFIFLFLFFIAGTESGMAQMCLFCNGSGVTYETVREWKYDGVVNQGSIGWGGQDWYTYSHKSYVKKSVRHTCAGCNGTGVRVRRTRQTVQRKAPETRYVTTTEMIELNVNKLRQGYNIEENFGNRYLYVEQKGGGKGMLVRVKSTEVGHEVILRGINYYSGLEHTHEGDFHAYSFRVGRGNYFYDANFELLGYFDDFSSYCGFEGLYWADSDEVLEVDRNSTWGKKTLAHLVKLPGQEVLTPTRFIQRTVRYNEYEFWKDTRLLVAQEYIKNRYNEWELRVGIINEKGAYAIPPLFNRPANASEASIFEYDPEAKIFWLFDGVTQVFHYFNLDLQEITTKAEVFKTCPNGDQILRESRTVWNAEKEQAEPGYIYELKSKDGKGDIPAIYGYCTCYDEQGMANVWAINSADTISIQLDGLVASAENLALIEQHRHLIQQPVTVPSQLEQLREHRLYNYRIEERKGANGQPEFSMSPYKKWYTEMTPIGFIIGMRNNKREGYTLSYNDGDDRFSYIKTNYIDFDLASKGDILPVKDITTGKWGGIKLSSSKKGDYKKPGIPCKYDKIEQVGEEYYAYQGEQIDYYKVRWVKGEKEKVYRLTEPAEELSQNRIDWALKTEIKDKNLNKIYSTAKIDPDKDQLTFYKKIGLYHLMAVNGERTIVWAENYPQTSVELPPDIVDIRVAAEKEEAGSSYTYFTWLLQHKNGRWGIGKGYYKEEEVKDFETVINPEMGFIE